MNTKDLVLTCCMTALIAVMALFPPITLFFAPTPITLQTLGVMLSGSLLGAKRAGMSLLFFLLLLALGIPILAGLVGGIGIFFTPYGGFVLAWPLGAFAIGWLTEKLWQKLNFVICCLINIFGGIVILYLIGVPWMSVFAKLSLLKSCYLAIMYLPGDLLKVVIASWIAMTFKKYQPLISLPDISAQKI